MKTYHSNIPKRMREYDHWVLCSKDKKIPVSIDGTPASVSNPETWTSFDNAVKALSRQFPYLGFVFTKDDPFVGIDIDNGRNGDGSMSKLALDIISRTHSYVEISKSRRGFHIIVTGRLPFPGKNNGEGLEIYDTGRFFIMTGDVLETNTEIETGASLLSYTVNTYFAPKPKQYSGHGSGPKVLVNNSKGSTIKTEYRAIPEGSRNSSLLSVASQLILAGYDSTTLLGRLSQINLDCCTPPLPDKEVKAIVKQALKYSRR